MLVVTVNADLVNLSFRNSICVIDSDHFRGFRQFHRSLATSFVWIELSRPLYLKFICASPNFRGP